MVYQVPNGNGVAKKVIEIFHSATFTTKIQIRKQKIGNCFYHSLFIRCNTLISLIEKENNEIEEKEKAERAKKKSAAKEAEKNKKEQGRWTWRHCGVLVCMCA